MLQISNERGAALIVTMAIMVMLTIAAILAVDTAITDINLSFNQMQTDQAFYVAEAGIRRAVVALNADYEWRTGYANVAFGPGLYWVAVSDSTGDSTLGDTVVLRSAADVQGARANIEAWVVPRFAQPFRYAAFGEDSLVMRNTACTDSYNSDSGAYDATLSKGFGDIGSNGDIILANEADVYGDAWTASGGSITVDNSAQVYGDTTTSAPEYDMTIIEQSEFDWAENNNSAPSGFSGDYRYNDKTSALSLNNKYDSLVLSSGVYYFSSITLSQYASLLVAPGAQVSIYVSGNLTIGQGASINPGGSPSDLLIYSQGTELNIGEHSEFRAAFWGPNATIKVEQNTNVYGSLVGDAVRIVNSACIHYDRSLLKITRDVIAGMGVVAWREL